MKRDFRRQGLTVEEMDDLFEKYPHTAARRVPAMGRIHCVKCGQKAAWFYLYPDMAVCVKCAGRYRAKFPANWFTPAKARVLCWHCGKMKFSLYMTNIQCQKCGVTKGINGSIMLTPLFDPPPELELPPRAISKSGLYAEIKRLKSKEESKNAA